MIPEATTLLFLTACSAFLLSAAFFGLARLKISGPIAVDWGWGMAVLGVGEALLLFYALGGRVELVIVAQIILHGVQLWFMRVMFHYLRRPFSNWIVVGGVFVFTIFS